LETKLELPSNVKKMNPEELEKLISSFEILVPQLKKLKEKKSLPSNSLAKFADEYLEILKSASAKKYVKSVKLTLNYLMDYFGKEKSISEIGREDVHKFIAKLKVNAPKGYRVYFRNLKAAFNIALEWEYIEVNLFAKVKLPKKQKEKPVYVTKDQLDLILGAMTNDTLKAIVHYAFFTGSRRGEILNLKWKNIDFNKKIITIGDEDFQTKTKSQRIMPMAQNLFDKLWERSDFGKISASKPDSFVFAKPNGFPFHEDVPTKSFKRACRKVGIDKKVHFHSLRHSFASFMVQNGVGLYNVQKLLGHSSITTTEIYSHLNVDALHESVKVFDDIKK
jgi:site-specific recombinase XerD